MEPHFAAVDWGTSSFRIWLMSDDGTPLAEKRSDEGMTHASNAGFENVLETHLGALSAPKHLPVVICGMAGSRQGWQEARYLTVPAALSDIVTKAVRVTGVQRDIRILPGLAQRDQQRPDVMRGEETQLLGGLVGKQPVGLACLPGTHSKWVRFADGHVSEFSSQMTGELFGLLAKKSILRHAVGDGIDTDPESPDFVHAVRDGYASPAEISRMLFSLRAAQLLFDKPRISGFTRLSGLLIGSEIAAAGLDFGMLDNVHLIASGKHLDLYQSAFAALEIVVDAFDADRAVLAGLMIAARQYWPLPDQQTDFGKMKA
jgi:2-dehydro-3-deoxygalactonokinase